MTADRNRKLAAVAALAEGLLHGMPAFDDRREEMGPGPAARGNGRGAKGEHSSPQERAAAGAPQVPVVRSEMDKLVNDLYDAAMVVEVEYQRIARTTHGLPSKGEPSCAWCDEAVQAAARVAATALAKARAKGDELVSLGDLAPIPLDFRSPTYLFAEVRKGDKVVGKQLVCLWCYRFNLRHERKPTIDERWIHAQGGRLDIDKPKRPRMKAAERLEAKAG